jgi:hypothetical protein
VPMNFADDLAVFFDPEEHGEAIRYNGVGGFSAIWNRPTGDLEVNGGRFVVATNVFMLPITQVAKPVIGDTITVVRTLDRFSIDGEPRLNDDGTVWACEVS